MSDLNSVEVDQEKTAKNESNKNKRKEPKAKRQRTDINQRVLTNPFRRLSTEKEMSISMVGLDGAGKTTILYKLGEDKVEKTSAEGLHLETLVYDNITLNAWDVSGAHKTRLQGIHFEDTKGLIFVVDSTARDKLDRAKRELHMLLNEDLLKDVVLLVFANKQDVPKRMNEADITEMLGLSSPIPQRHRRVQFTCATSGEGLYKGLDWLSRKIEYTCATSGEGVNKGLNLLRNMRDTKEYFYRKYNDLPIGRFFNPSDEELIDFLVRLNNGNDISPDRVNRVNLFRNHPAIIIKSHYLHHYMLDTRKYYLFYCKVPANAKYSLKGYHHFQDRAKGVWQTTRNSFIFRCNLLDKTTRYGERQRFRYKPVNETTSFWRMVMYGLPDFPRQQSLPNIPRPQSNMVILKVYESADSKNEVAVKSLDNLERDVLETSNAWSTNVAKIELLETALREEKMKRDGNWLDLGAKTHRLTTSKKVILKVYESAKSKNAMAVKSLANLEKDVLETSNIFSANVAKIELLETALREEKMKRDTNWLGLGAKTRRLIRRVKKYSHEEHKEADEIMRRTSRIRIAKAILKNRSKHTRD